MICYRVQYPLTKRGPYNWNLSDNINVFDILKKKVIKKLDSLSDNINISHGDNAHPTPYGDGIKFDTVVCAMANIPSVNKWFSGWTKALKECGFELVELDTNGAKWQKGKKSKIQVGIDADDYWMVKTRVISWEALDESV